MNLRDQFLQILKRWPVDSSRESMEYGFYLRGLVNNSLATGNPFPGNSEENAKKLESLQRLVNNTYYREYPPISKYGATNLPLNDLKVILNNNFIKDFNKGKKPGSKTMDFFRKKSADSSDVNAEKT